jgi:branched-chain amino acid transport system substrate-binding protein
MKRRNVFAAGAAWLAMCAFGVSAQEPTHVVKVGVIAPMSGPFADYGKMWDAAAKAYQKLNGTTAGGAKVEIIWKDLPELNPAHAKALAQELVIKDKVQYIGGMFFTPDAIAVASVAQEAKVPTVIFNAATSSLLDKSEFLLRTSYTLPQVSVPVAKYALDKKVKTVVTLVSDFSAGIDSETAFTKTFEAGGGKVVEQIRAPLKTTDFGPYLQKIKSLKPDAMFVFVPGGPPAYSLIKAYKESGLRQAGIRFLGTAETNEVDLPSLGDEAVGVETLMNYSTVHPSKLNESFIRTMRGVAPTTKFNGSAVQAFDGFAVIYKMIEATKGQADGVKAVAAVRGLQWESPRGPLKIDPASRELVQNVYARVVEKDKSGLLVNREVATYAMQPDHGRAAALQSSK